MASARALLSLNDRRLAAYLTATDDAARNLELERILAGDVQKRARALLAEYFDSDWPIEPNDADDIVSTVTLRVLRKLRAASIFEEESIQNLEAYVTTVTKNSMRDLMRRRSPERTRMKSRLLYLFQHDSRLAVWSSDGVTLCGLAAWKDRVDAVSADEAVRSAVWSNREGDFAATVVAAITVVGRPVRLRDLVSAYVSEKETYDGSESKAVEEPAAAAEVDALEARQYLQILWDEIRALPAKQRAALLLNLREPGSGNAVLLLVAVGIATLEEVASTVEMSSEQLAAIWNDLPLSDSRIAAHLGLQRQQVINLRKSARERLARRMLRPMISGKVVKA
jgi:RNA polymerase sigma factor (sigma-70 family)